MAGEDGGETGARSFVTEKTKRVLLIVGREEKRQTLDMIPMGVGNEKSQLDWPGAEFLFQGDAQLAHARSRRRGR